MKALNLAFMTRWPDGSPTYFPEMIWNSFDDPDIISLFDRYCNPQPDYPEQWQYYFHEETLCGTYRRKPHTIRFLTKKRAEQWKRIGHAQPFIWTEKPYRSKQFKFCPVIPVQIKELEIDYYAFGKIEPVIDDRWSHKIIEYTDKRPDQCLMVKIDKRRIYTDQWDELAINDGFESVDKFFEYFSEELIDKNLNHKDKNGNPDPKHPYLIQWGITEY